MMACAVILVCRFIRECRRIYLTRGGIFELCAVNYVKTRVICIHFFIHSRTKQLENARSFCLYLSQVFLVSENIFVSN